jgi:hypothetical protein
LTIDLTKPDDEVGIPIDALDIARFDKGDGDSGDQSVVEASHTVNRQG